MQKSGAEILIAELQANGVDTLFGYPGSSILSVYDALYKSGSIRHVMSVDERGAVFMADGYARSSGRVGVCLATSGPGATNLVTGIASAFMDSVPMVIITGNVSLENLGHDSFQEVDTTGITMPVTKYNYIVKDIKKLAYAVSEAFALADSGRKGPVLIDVPQNVFDEVCEYTRPTVAVKKMPAVNPAEIEKAVEIINSAKKPLIYVGGGAMRSNTADAAVTLSEKLNAPVGVSFMGIGGVPSSFKNYIGVGTAVNRIAKEALRECDVFISLGARFSNKATEKSLYNKNVKLVHLDIDNAEIDKIHFAEGAVRGNLSDTLPLIISKVAEKPDRSWLDEVLSKKRAVPLGTASHEKYIRVLNGRFGSGQRVATDVGQHQLWVANYYDFDYPRRFLSSGGLGAMGFGIGAAIGAYFATREDVLLVTGDGSFNMSFNELLTAKEYGVPLTIVIMNNGTLGMVREVQGKKHGINCDLTAAVDYEALAKAYGARYYKAKNPAELEALLSTYEVNGTAIFDCTVSKYEKSI